jgi:hypothetical protein
VSEAQVATDGAPRSGASGPPGASGRSGTRTGNGIVRASWIGTAVFAVAAAVGAAKPDPYESLVTGVSLGLFAVGVVAFLLAFGTAVSRSRTEEIAVMGVWFLSGSAPRDVRRRLLGSFAVQVLIAVVAASIRPFTEVAFGVLVPVFGLGLAGLWGARHGTFPERRD